MGVFHLNLSPRRENKSCAIHRPLSHICNLRPGNGNPARGENEVCVGSARLSLRAENWRNHSDGISRKHRVLVSFSRNKGSSFLQLCPSLCIKISAMEKMYEFPSTGLVPLQEMDLLEGSKHVWLLYSFNLAIHPCNSVEKRLATRWKVGMDTQTDCLREQPANKQQ